MGMIYFPYLIGNRESLSVHAYLPAIRGSDPGSSVRSALEATDFMEHCGMQQHIVLEIRFVAQLWLDEKL